MPTYDDTGLTNKAKGLKNSAIQVVGVLIQVKSNEVGFAETLDLDL